MASLYSYTIKYIIMKEFMISMYFQIKMNGISKVNIHLTDTSNVTKVDLSAMLDENDNTKEASTSQDSVAQILKEDGGEDRGRTKERRGAGECCFLLMLF